MSLLDGLLRDALLQNVVQSEVWLANRTDGETTGSGTQFDPYSAKGSSSDPDPRFDQIMRALPPNATVRLLPGMYYTRGFNAAFTNTGWRAPSGVREARRKSEQFNALWKARCARFQGLL